MANERDDPLTPSSKGNLGFTVTSPTVAVASPQAAVTSPKGGNNLTMKPPPPPTLPIGIKLRTTKGIVQTKALYTKEDRKSLTGEDRVKLIATIIGNRQKKFEHLTLAIDDEKQLGTTYSTKTLIGQMRDNLAMYELDEVFSLVIPRDIENSASIEPTRLNLFDHYHSIKLSEVLASNEYFNCWVDESSLVQEDLELTFCYMYANVEEALYNKVRESYDTFPISQRGGPLFFWLLMNTISTNSEATIESLITKVRKFRIKDHPGEDILQITSILRNCSQRIHNARDNKLPERFLQDMLEVLQTSSVPEFNKQFEGLHSNHLLQSTIARSDCGASLGILTNTLSLKNDLSSIEALLSLADNLYSGFEQSGTWRAHVRALPGKSGFAATASDSDRHLVCDNCAKPGHTSRDCSEPRDAERIKVNRDKRLGRSHSPGRSRRADRRHKYRKPEDHEHGLRIIDGKPHRYNEATKRWDLQDSPDTGAPSPAPAPPSSLMSSPPPHSIDIPTPAPSDGGGSLTPALEQEKLAMKAELTRQFEAFLASV